MIVELLKKNLLLLMVCLLTGISLGAQDDCDCPEEFDPVCVVDEDGNIFPLPNACYAACLGLEISDEECDDFGGGDDFPGADCDCPEEDWDSEGICIEVEAENGIESGWVPSECYVSCWYGDVEYAIVDCDDLWEWEDSTSYEIDTCLLVLIDEDFLTLQSFLLALGESCELELPACILDAPIFDTDDEFIAYLEENCPDVLGGLFSSEGENAPSLFSRYNSGGGGALISATEEAHYEVLSLNILGNPVSETLTYQIVAKQATPAQVSITDMNGKTINAQQLQLSAGTTTLELDMTNSTPSLYFLSIQTETGITNLKFFKE